MFEIVLLATFVVVAVLYTAVYVFVVRKVRKLDRVAFHRWFERWFMGMTPRDVPETDLLEPGETPGRLRKSLKNRIPAKEPGTRKIPTNSW